MKNQHSIMSGRFSGLSSKLIVTIIGVILFVEIIVYLPSVASFRTTWLEDRLRVGVVAARVLDAVPDVMALPRDLTDRLLNSAGANAIVYRREGQSQMIELTNPVMPDAVVTADLRQGDLPSRVWGALDTLFAGPGRTLRVVGAGDMDESLVELLMPEAPLRRDMIDYSRSIALVSLGIAAVTAFVLYVLVSRLFIDPVLRLTDNMLAFRKAPENAALILAPSSRRDEIGILERELAEMESELFSMLRQRRHLADLGLAVAKINHDLRNTLTSAQLLSDQVATLDDPKVQRLAPRLVTTLDKAIGFAQSVLDYGRETSVVPRFAAVSLRTLVEDAAFEARVSGNPMIGFENEVDAALMVDVDAGQMGRVLVNLLKNAREALETGSLEDRSSAITVAASSDADRTVISVADNGPGLPPRARENLFVAFEGSARSGGTGLGLAIAREIVEAHGGALALAETGQGTRFDITLPSRRPLV
ncbi:HAMP domain-containing histidine kinase [Devosia sp. XJ19-1]|uniref:histidine kinase n=1 Tax=Devosia ureilytica TaxID=2952754 RepID=A0A9Q4AR45_9HYPH|nr:HAMP domain-containing sensor histidine kinase [Devosia ureilytica]MCP8884506.1 HAMP domain-containing histidine kinase [Devosia ureilytica]MCP8888136.1 HAMP domain-containing histidine kinase [Devosia ureilytica]